MTSPGRRFAVMRKKPSGWLPDLNVFDAIADENKKGNQDDNHYSIERDLKILLSFISPFIFKDKLSLLTRLLSLVLYDLVSAKK